MSSSSRAQRLQFLCLQSQVLTDQPLARFPALPDHRQVTSQKHSSVLSFSWDPSGRAFPSFPKSNENRQNAPYWDRRCSEPNDFAIEIVLLSRKHGSVGEVDDRVLRQREREREMTRKREKIRKTNKQTGSTSDWISAQFQLLHVSLGERFYTLTGIRITRRCT